MGEFPFLSVVIFFGAVQGIILVFAINQINNANQLANRVLSIFVLLISLVLFSRLVYVEGTTIWLTYPHLFLIPDITLFLYGPLFYLYILYLLKPNDSPLSKHWLHFILFFCHLIVLGFYLLESKAVYLKRLMTGDLWEVPYVSFLSLLQIAIYVVWSYFIFLKAQRQFEAGSKAKFPIRYLNYFYLLVGFCWLTWLYSSLSSLLPGLPKIQYFSYNLSWVALSFVTFLLAYFAMSQKDVFKLKPLKKKYENSLLSKDETGRSGKKASIAHANFQAFPG